MFPMSPNVKHKASSAHRNELARAKPQGTLASLFANLHADAHTALAPAAPRTATDDDVIDVGGVVELLHVGRNMVYEMVARNEIPHRRFGRRIRFSRTAIMRWLDSWSPRIVKEGQ
jgi:excisionase family DNA binding protein